MNHSPISRWHWWTWTAISLHFLLLLFLGLSRHWGYLSSLNDLGVFDQAAWGTLRGQFLLNTSQFNQPINWLGFHFHPVILLFTPLYAIAPYAEWFTLAQALALSMTAWPIFLLASRVCQSKKSGLLWALTYLVNPFLLNAAAWDFHPVALAVPFIALGLLAVEKSDNRLLLLSCLPLLFIQEQLGLTVTAFGVLWWIRNRSWKTAASFVLLGIVHTALVLGVIMPTLSPTGQHIMLGRGLGQLSRYAWLGNSPGDIALNFLLHPWSVAQKVLFNMWGAPYLITLLLPLLGFPLAAPVYLLPALPDLAANLLSANAMPKSVFAYHSVTLVPVLTLASVYGVRRISLWRPWLSSVQISGVTLTASLIWGYALAPLPIHGAINFWAPAHLPIAPDPVPAAIRATLSSASVSAQANIGAHFSQRSQIYPYPSKLDDVEAIILRLESPTRKIFPNNGDLGSLDSHLQMRPAEYIASIECLLAGKNYGVLLWNDPWLIFSRNATTREHRSNIMQKLERMKIDWHVEPEEYQLARQKCVLNPDYY